MFAVSLFLCLLRPDPTLAGVSTPESLTLTLTLTLTMPMRKTMDMADILTLALVLTLTILVRSLPARYLRRAYRLEQHHPRLLRLCIPFDGLRRHLATDFLSPAELIPRLLSRAPPPGSYGLGAPR